MFYTINKENSCQVNNFSLLGRTVTCQQRTRVQDRVTTLQTTRRHHYNRPWLSVFYRVYSYILKEKGKEELTRVWSRGCDVICDCQTI